MISLVERKSDKEIEFEAAANAKNKIIKDVCPYRVNLLDEDGNVVKDEYSQPVKKETWELSISEILCLCDKYDFSILKCIRDEQKINDSWCKLNELTNFMFKTKKGAELGGADVYGKLLKSFNGMELFKTSVHIKNFWEYMTEQPYSPAKAIVIMAKAEALEDSIRNDPPYCPEPIKIRQKD